MAIALLTLGTTKGGSATVASTFTIATPTGLADGCVVYLAIATNNNSTTATQANSNDSPTPLFTLLRAADDSGPNIGLSVFRRVVTTAASEPASYAFKITNLNGSTAQSVAYGWALIALSGVDNTTPEDVSMPALSSASSSSTTETTPSTSSTTDQSWAVAFCASDQQNAITVPSGYTNLVAEVTGRACAVATKGPITPAGSIAAASFSTGSNGAPYVAGLVSVRPVSSTATVTRTANPVTAPLQTLNSPRTAGSLSAALLSTAQQTATSITAALSGSVQRVASPLDGALQSLGLLRTTASLSAALGTSGARAAAPVLAILLLTSAHLAPCTAAFSASPTRTSSPIGAALSSVNRARSASQVTCALSALNVSRTGSPVQVALGSTTTRAVTSTTAALSSVSLSRAAGLTTAVLSSNSLARTATPLQVSLQLAGTRTANPCSASLLGSVQRQASPVSVTLSSGARSRTATSVQAVLLSTNTRAASPIAAALLENAIVRTSAPLVAALSVEGVARTAPLLVALGTTQGRTTSSSAALQATGLGRVALSVQTALQTTDVQRSATLTAALLGNTLVRTATPESAALVATSIRSASPVAACLLSGPNTRTSAFVLARLASLDLSHAASCTAALAGPDQARSAANVSAGLQTLDQARPASPVLAVTLATASRQAGPAAALGISSSRTLSGLSVALRQTGRRTTSPVSAALQQGTLIWLSLSGTSGGSATASTSFSIARPGGLVDGSALYLGVATNNNGATATVANSTDGAWTRLQAGDDSGPNVGLSVFRRVVASASTEPSSYAFNITNAGGLTAQSVDYGWVMGGLGGVDPVTPEDVSMPGLSSSSFASTTETAPATSCVANLAWAVAFCAFDRNTALVFGAPAGYGNLVSHTGAGRACALATRGPISPPGTIAAASFGTGSTGGAYVAGQVSVRPVRALTTSVRAAVRVSASLLWPFEDVTLVAGPRPLSFAAKQRTRTLHAGSRTRTFVLKGP